MLWLLIVDRILFTFLYQTDAFLLSLSQTFLMTYSYLSSAHTLHFASSNSKILKMFMNSLQQAKHDVSQTQSGWRLVPRPQWVGLASVSAVTYPGKLWSYSNVSFLFYMFAYLHMNLIDLI